MCRLAAIVHFGNQRISSQEVEQFLKNMKNGGVDATGMIFVQKDKYSYSKFPGTIERISDFHQKTEGLIQNSEAIILHTRQATHGNPANNNNNHPILGQKYLLVHNGVLSLDEKFPACGTTDTEQLLRSMEQYGIKRGMEKARGSCSIIFINKKSRDIFFYTNNGSIVAGWDKTRKIFFLASTEEIILNSVNRPLFHCLFNGIEIAGIKKNVLYRIQILGGKRYIQKCLNIKVPGHIITPFNSYRKETNNGLDWASKYYESSCSQILGH